MGAHEFYWFPYKRLLMAKLSDGSSFRFFRFSGDFRTVATAITASNVKTNHPMTQFIDSPEFRLFQVPGRNMVAPRFWKKLAYFYVSSQDMSK